MNRPSAFWRTPTARRCWCCLLYTSDYRQDNPVRDLTQSQDSQLTTKDGPVVKNVEYVEISHSESYKSRFLYDHTNNVYLMQQNFSGNWRCLLYTSRCV